MGKITQLQFPFFLEWLAKNGYILTKASFEYFGSGYYGYAVNFEKEKDLFNFKWSVDSVQLK